MSGLLSTSVEDCRVSVAAGHHSKPASCVLVASQRPASTSAFRSWRMRLAISISSTRTKHTPTRSRQRWHTSLPERVCLTTWKLLSMGSGSRDRMSWKHSQRNVGEQTLAISSVWVPYIQFVVCFCERWQSYPRRLVGCFKFWLSVTQQWIAWKGSSDNWCFRWRVGHSSAQCHSFLL